MLTLSVEVVSPWGVYRYTANANSAPVSTKATVFELEPRAALEHIDRTFMAEVADECRRCEAAARSMRIEHPLAVELHRIAMAAHEFARDQEIRKQCEADGWHGEQFHAPHLEDNARKERAVCARFHAYGASRSPFYGDAMLGIGFDSYLIAKTIGRLLYLNASTITVEEHMCRKGMGALWSAFREQEERA